VVVGLPTKPEARRFALSVIIGCIPAFAAGLLLHGVIKHFFENPWLPQVICVSLIVGGILLLIVDKKAPAPREMDGMALSLKTAFLIGLFQCLSLLPGVSRSGSTIVGSMLIRVERKAAAEFSFFMAIPIMVGAFALDLLKSYKDIDPSHAGTIAIGFVVSFLSGLVVVKTMIAFIGKRGFTPFAWWRIVVGVIGLGLIYMPR